MQEHGPWKGTEAIASRDRASIEPKTGQREEKTMIDLVARILVALATTAATAFGTTVVATQWAAGTSRN